MDSKIDTWKHTLLLSFQSFGVIYGRLTIAPLYVFGTICADDIKTEEALYGLLSFIFWTMTIIPLVKYAAIVLRTDDNGEGGTFALYSLLCRHAKVGLLPNLEDSDEFLNYETGSNCNSSVGSRARRAVEKHKSSHYIMLFLALFGSCMVIGDGVLTPAISVLSASFGLARSVSDISINVFSSSRFQPSLSNKLLRYVPVPSACAILIILFTVQHYGTHKIGFMFAPIVILWLLLISGVGLYNIILWNQHIIYSVYPYHMFRFIRSINIESWRSLSSVLLCIAGSEAMFADLGHLSKKSIKFTFVSFVYPALLLSYAGQAAFISKNGHFSKNKANVIHAVFRKKCEGHYLLEENVMAVPVQLRHVFTVLSLLASIVGSQATITATFSIIKQCLALGCFPRVKIIHTSNKIHGQVYIPDVNWILMVLCLTLVVVFQEIGLIANATGLAIILGMLVTTFLMSLVITLHWEKSIAVSACFLIFFGFIEVLYLCACLLSFHKGAWYLVVLVAISLSTMLAWHYGTMKKYESDLQNKVSMDWLTNLSPGLGVARVPGIGFIYTDIVTGIPGFFSHFVTNLPAFHQILIFVTFKSVPVPFVPPSRRYLIGRVGPNEYRVYRCIVRNGYCERIRDTDDFEDQLISTIGEFITIEENDIEDLSSSEGRMIVIGNPRTEGKNALIPLGDSCSTVGLLNLAHNESPMTQFGECSRFTPNRRKKVRFLVPQEKTRMQTSSVRQELQELEDARESGTAYFLGQSHLVVRDGSNFVKQFLVMIYVFLNKNCREHPVALNIPHAALVEVGMVYAV